ncbi:MAG: Vitamin B12 transporter BtuB precursor [Lentisphaerae bacterium ADurb.BinA184]|nr:MAG: Vitamin B12 transporter BtuB precursor [Lentisphaerae bacterium ADurb.BinA184]
MVVTASRGERAAATVPANTTVITADDIAATTAFTVPDVLKHLAGVEVADWGGNGRKAGVDIRGFGETAAFNTLVLVDGRRINSADMSGVDWTTIPLERIARIEVVRGGNSVLYGDQAVGGVVNIITKQGAPADTLTSETSVASYSTFRQALGFAGSRGPVSYAVNASYLDGKGYRTNGYLRNRTAGLSLGYDGGQVFNWRLSAGVKQDRYGMPGALPEGGDPRDTTYPYAYGETENAYAQFVPSLKLGDDTTLELGLSYSGSEFRSEFPEWDWSGRWRIHDLAVAPKLTTAFELGVPHTLTAGLDYQGADLHDITFGLGDMHRHEAGYYLSDTLALVPDQLFLDLGYRRARVNYDYANYTDAAHDLDAWRAGLTWNYAPQSKLFLSFDRSYRTQKLEELGGDYLDTPVAPQVSRQYQAGVRHHFADWLTAAVTAFQIDSRDEILADYFYGPTWWGGMGWSVKNVNYEETRRRGIELELESRPCEKLLLFANYTWLDHEMTAGQHDGHPIPGVAEHSGNFGFMLSPTAQLAWDVRARWHAGKRMTSDWEDADEGWSGRSCIVVDTKLTWTPCRWLELYAGVNNVFDEEYAEYGLYDLYSTPARATSYPSPGRNFVAGFRLTAEF